MRKIFLLFILLILSPGCEKFQKPPPVLGKLPEFALQDQHGQQIGLKDLEGRVWATNFIFTSCAGTCPMLTQRMKRVLMAIQGGALAPYQSQVGILSITVDPERDNPKVLSEYAKNFKVESPQWKFLTGPFAEIEKTVVKGFKIAMGKVPSDKSEGEEPYNVIHGEKFILLDDHGRIRGYYEVNDPGISKLIHDMKKLASGISS